MLSNGWLLSPAGTSIDAGDLPLGMDISDDGKIAVLINNGQSKHSIMIVDVEQKRIAQTLVIKKSWVGVVMRKDARGFFVSGGNDNVIHEYALKDMTATLVRSIPLWKERVSENISPGGITLGNNDSLLFVATKGSMTLYKILLSSGAVVGSVQLPAPLYSCVYDPQRHRVCVSVWGGSQVAVVDEESLAIVKMVRVGDHPCDMLLSKDNSRLFVANANNNTVSVLDLSSLEIEETIGIALSPDAPNGSTPNALALSRDGETLFVANADNNCLAVIDVERRGRSRGKGFIPTGWYPTALRCAGNMLLVTNGKGMSSKANPGGEYIGSLLGGSLSFIDIPTGKRLDSLTALVYRNTPSASTGMPEWKLDNPIPLTKGCTSPLKHVFYIIKENRTYDQVLGDMERGNGDPSLAIFGKKVSPNHHALADEFVLLDNFYVDAEVSADGHNWSMAAYATDYVEKTWPTSYGGRGGTYDYENEGIMSPSVGYIWDNCLRHNVSFRNYGEFMDEDLSSKGVLKPNAKGLMDHSSPDYRGWDLNYLDTKRAEVWIKEFDAYEKGDSLPSFQILRLPNDHTAGTKRGIRTPRAMVAENDLALGMIVERISRSTYWPQSAIFVLEDDAQNGPDHVDAHRSIAFVISPYVRRRVVDHSMYSTSGMLRTMELILGLPPMSQFDAAALPMFASFTSTPDLTPYVHRKNIIDLDERNLLGAYGQDRMETFSLAKEDEAPDIEFNKIIWRSIRDTEMPAPVHSAFVLAGDE
ncbi:MAG: beta-propeller fold lactonase family protein [Ignavibacteriales bacterium]|nr:beta-propeller fold lactonase family protein [Ignavibacteriales bacterium]